MKTLNIILTALVILISFSSIVLAQLGIQQESGSGLAAGTIDTNLTVNVSETLNGSCEQSCYQEYQNDQELFDLCIQNCTQESNYTEELIVTDAQPATNPINRFLDFVGGIFTGGQATPKLDNPSVTGSAPCTDTDGGDVSTKQGTTTGPWSSYTSEKDANDNTVSKDKVGTFVDKCYGTKSLTEYFCANGKVTKRNVNCLNFCEDGICQGGCSDNDGGKNYGSKGFTYGYWASSQPETDRNGKTVSQGDTGSFYDKCVDSKRLDEYYCGGDKVRKTTTTCKYGCGDGKCLEPSCTDTDGGKKENTKGTATGPWGTSGTVTDSSGNSVSEGDTGSFDDKCASVKSVREYYCSDDKVTATTITCKDKCVDGECDPIPCTDTDRGKTYNTKGSATGKPDSYASYAVTRTDSCYDSTNLKEIYCENGVVKDEIKRCDFKCENGACVEKPDCTETDGGRREFTKGTTTGFWGESGSITDSSGNNVGYKGTGTFEDQCTGQKGLKEFYCTSSGSVSSASITCNDKCEGGRCVTISCSDTDYGKKYDKQGTTTGKPYSSSTSSTTKTDYCSGSGDLREFYCDSGVVKDEYKKCDFVCEGGKCVEKPACTETDGGRNRYQKGTATGADSNENTGTFTDNCISSKTLEEYYCYDGTVRKETSQCSDRCSEGKCVDIPCTDSDGKDYNQRGTTRGEDPYHDGSSITRTDSCFGSNQVKEYFCSDGNVRDESHRCDFKCDDGACIDKPTYSCTDTDGQNMRTKGSTTGKQTPDGTSSTSTDFCSGSGNRLTEFYCTYEGLKKSTDYYCSYKCENGVCVNEPECTETDSGKDFYNKGSSSGGWSGYSSEIDSSGNSVGYKESGTFEDQCTGINTLKEYFCASYGKVSSATTTCKYGCQDGQCISDYSEEDENCLENDDGIDVSVASDTDACIDEYTLEEHFCGPLGEGSNKAEIICEFGCKNGACLKSPSKDAGIDTEPKPDSGGLSFWLNILRGIFGKPANDTGVTPSINIPDRPTTIPIINQPSKSTDSKDDPYTKGTTSGNTKQSDIDDNDQVVVEGQASSFTDKCTDDASGVQEYFCVTYSNGTSRVDSRETACTYGCVDGACSSKACSSTDASDSIYVKGTTEGIVYTDMDNNSGGTVKQDTWGAFTDQCYDEYGLNEYYCYVDYDGLAFADEKYTNCPNGCADGACSP